MLLVAFSRRMCCSRVDSVSTQPRRPSASTVSPASRPGIWRTNFSRRGEQADIGPAEIQRVADRLALRRDDVGAHLARRRDAGRATRSRSRPRSAARPWRGRPRRAASQIADLAEEARGSARRRRRSRRRSARPDPRRLPGRGGAAIDLEAGEARVGLDDRRGNADAGRPTAPPCSRRVTRLAISTASAQAVAPSYSEALATSMPVISATWVWNSNRYCSVPCAISGW